MMKGLGRLVILLVVTVVGFSLSIGMTYADTQKSSDYEFINTDLGSGGLVPSSSTNYKSVLSTGDSAVGQSSSTNYQSAAGSVTTGDPALSLSVPSGQISFNTLFGPSTTATATAEFSVIDYTSYGYAVQITGNAPTNGSHTIPAMSNGSGGPTTSTVNTEQFGINLVANTTPNVGANPNYKVFSTTSAKPTTNYDSPNNFYFSDGDSIASSPKSSGEVDYTISYVVNVNSLTPGGQYTSAQSIICTGTY